MWTVSRIFLAGFSKTIYSAIPYIYISKKATKMGFKRTAEGRVFFETPYDNQGKDNQSQGGGGDLQIAGLLRALNERLKDAQAERTRLLRELQDFRTVIDELEDRAGRSEQAYIDLEQKVAVKQGVSFEKAERAERAAKETLEDILEARNSLSELLDKSEDGEKVVSAVKLTLEENKKLILEMRKRQAVLEKLQKEQGEKMVDHVAAYVSMSKRINSAEARYAALDNKIEDTTSKQLQLDRKFEKSNEDRMRLLRKIDRIEETVIQMRDTLNAKAMVVLADPNATTAPQPRQLRSEYEEQPQPVIAREPMVLKNKAPGMEALSWWTKPNLPASAITVVTAFFIMGGLILMMELSSPLQGSVIGGRIANFLDDNKWQSVAGDGVVQSELIEPEVVNVQEELRRRDRESDIARIAPPQPAPQAQEEPGQEQFTQYQAPAVESDPADDIGAVDLNNQEQLIAALEEDPDALAAQLNAIEPGAEITEAPAAEETEIAAVDSTASVEEVLSATAAPERLTSEAPPIREKTTLAERIQPDSSLPAKVKDIEQQAFAGVAEAQHDLAAIYTAGHGGVKVDYERAAQWFREAADNGVANARYNLGVLYHQGMGVERSIEDAIKWYTAAADLGHPEAQYNLGIAYIEGIGVPYDPSKASNYFENAAKSGITEAAYNLGLIHENGLLGQAKPDEALMWYKTAADKGSPEAKAALEQLAKTLNINVNEVNAIADKVKESRIEASPPVAAPTKVASAPKQTPKPAPLPQVTTQEEAYVRPVPEQQCIIMANVQGHLMRLGLYPGPADGVGGPLTEDAIRSYQSLSGLRVDGKPSQVLLDHMKAQINGDTETGSREE
jgi:TPR repeat protein